MRDLAASFLLTRLCIIKTALTWVDINWPMTMPPFFLAPFGCSGILKLFSRREFRTINLLESSRLPLGLESYEALCYCLALAGSTLWTTASGWGFLPPVTMEFGVAKGWRCIDASSISILPVYVPHAQHDPSLSIFRVGDGGPRTYHWGRYWGLTRDTRVRILSLGGFSLPQRMGSPMM